MNSNMATACWSDEARREIFRRASRAKRPTVIYCNAYGDHLLARPTILGLQSVFGDRLGFIGLRGYPEYFFGDIHFRNIQSVYFGNSESYGHAFSAHEVIDDGDFDFIININVWNNQDMSDLVRMVGHDRTLSLHSDYGLFPKDLLCNHYARHMFEMVREFNPTLRFDQFISLPPCPDQQRHLASYIRRKLKGYPRILCIQTQTSTRKMWSVDGFRQVLNDFLERHDDYGAIIVDQLDSDIDEGIHSNRIISLDGADLETCTELVAGSDLFLGVDSYFLHVADFAKVPTLGLFGPTSPVRWGCVNTPLFEHIRVDPLASLTSNEVLLSLENLAAKTTNI